jgi:DNA-binding NarL/FixJ family response regulator
MSQMMITRNNFIKFISTKMESKKTKILIVDDSNLFREALKLFLKNELNCEVIGEAKNGNEFLSIMKTIGHFVDIVLMDIQMPELDGITATKKWCLYHPQTKVIAITMYTDKAYLQQLIESGFKGCVYKTSVFEEIITAIKKVLSGDMYFNINIPIT